MKKHFNNIINALIAICPTRNYISQFLMLLPEEYASMYDSFPEFLNDKTFRGKLQYALGLTIGSEINFLTDSFAQNLVKLINYTFNIFNDEWISKWNEILGDVRSDTIPNLFQEWTLAKIELAIKDPTQGKIAFMILKYIYENQLSQSSKVEEAHNNLIFKKGVKMNDLISALQISKFELETTINFLTNKLKLIQIQSEKKEETTESIILLLAEPIKIEWLNGVFEKSSN